MTIGKVPKNQAEKILSNNINYNKNDLNKKQNYFIQRDYSMEDFEKLYANSQWKNNE